MRIRLPLWTHQLVEYVLAVLIVTQSIHVGKAATFMAVTGGLLFVLAATTDASMGALRWIPPQVHRGLDLAVIAALVAAPIVSNSTEPLAWALCLLAASALVWLHWHTRWSRATERAARPSMPIDADAAEPAAPAPTTPTTPTASTTPTAPTVAASLGDSARNLGKTVDRTARGASRAAGRIYGRARAQRSDSDEKPDPTA